MSDTGPIEDQGGSHSTFATTHWSVVLEAGQTGASEASEALEQLCKAYWYPLYAYIRRTGHDPHDAQDLVQAFFSRFLEKKYLQHADRKRGRFRTFLLSSLKNFLINDWIKANREKRGGSRQILSLDETTAETRLASEPAIEQPPDTLYDRGWAAILLDRAMVALREEFQSAGKQEIFERLKGFIWGEQSGLSYAAKAEQLSMTEGAVKVAVHRVRQRYGELLRKEIAQTVATPAEIDEELRYLVSIIRSGAEISSNSDPQKL